MAKQETNNRTMGVLYGRALVQPTTIDQEAREVDVVCATEKMVTRFSWDEDYYEGENETYIEASAENSGSILYDKEIRDKPRTRRTKRNV